MKVTPKRIPQELKIERNGTQGHSQNGTFNKITRTLHPILADKLIRVLEQESNLSLVHFQCDYAALNRIIGNETQAAQQLRSLPNGGKQALIDFLALHGFRLNFANKRRMLGLTKEVQVTLTDDPAPKTLSELEAFRQRPDDFETAKRLSKDHYDEVLEIFEYEVDNSVFDVKFLFAGWLFMYEVSEWQRMIPVAEKARKVLHTLIEKEGSLPSEEKSEARHDYDYKFALVHLMLAEVYFKTNQIEEADEAFRSFPTDIIYDNLMPHYILIGQLIYHDAKSPGTFLEFLYWLKENNLVSEDIYPTYIDYLMKAKLLLSLRTSPTPQEARALLAECRQNSEHLILGKLVELALFWNVLHAEPISRAKARIASTTKEIPPAIEALILQNEGNIAGAVELANKPLPHFEELQDQNLETSDLTALVARLKRIALLPIPSSAAQKPAAEQDRLSKIIFRNGWQHYHQVFPRRTREAIAKKLEVVITQRTKDLKAVELKEICDAIKIAGQLECLTEQDITKVKAEELGISQITLSWDSNNENIKVTIYPIESLKSSSPIFGSLNERMELACKGTKDLWDLEFAGRFLLAAVLAKLTEAVYESKDPPTLASAFVEETPHFYNSGSRFSAQRFLQTPVKPPRPNIAKPVETPASPEVAEPSAEELFCQENKNILDLCRAKFSELGVNLDEHNIKTITQIFSLIEIIENMRDRSAAPEHFSIEPLPTDPLAQIIENIIIHGPVQGEKQLQTAGFSAETISTFCFDASQPSPLLSVVEFKLSENKNLLGIIDRSGELIIPGTTTKDDFVTQLQRTALECLATAVVPEMEKIAEAQKDPDQSERNQAINSMISDEESGTKVTPRQRDLPALLIAPALRKLKNGNKTGALQTFGKQIKQRQIREEGEISLPLFTKSKAGIYELFPDKEHERTKLLRKLAPEDVFVQMSPGYAYRLALRYLKTTGDQRALLPTAMQKHQSEAAAANPSGPLDLDVRPYLYAVIEFETENGEPIYVVHPKASIKPQEELAAAKRELPHYEERELSGFAVNIHPNVLREIADTLLESPEAKATLASWQKVFSNWDSETEFPDFAELKYIGDERREKLAGARFINSFLLVMPTNRGYNQGLFIPLSEYDLPSAEENA